jgi:hypothetical protein
VRIRKWKLSSVKDLKLGVGVVKMNDLHATQFCTLQTFK